MQGVGGCPCVFQDVDDVDDDVHGDVPGSGLGVDQVDLVGCAVDQDHPGAQVFGVASLGLVEDRSDDLGGGVVDRAGQPLGAGRRPLAVPGIGDAVALGREVGVGDDVVDVAHGGFGVVDRAQGGHPLAAILLPG